MWKNLPSNVVNASTVNVFKSKIDPHWSEQEMMDTYDDDDEIAYFTVR